MLDPFRILRRLDEHKVEFTVIGGIAAAVRGSSLVTEDLDVCAPLQEENLSRILSALRDLHPKHRMRPDKMPVADDPARMRGIRNLYVLTDWGIIDFLGELPGIGTYEDAARQSTTVDLDEVRCKILNLETLIASKRFAGRPKDLRAVAELEIILARERRQGKLFE